MVINVATVCENEIYPEVSPDYIMSILTFLAPVSNVFKIFNMIYSKQKDTNSALHGSQFTAQSDWVGPQAKFKEGWI